MMVSAGLLAGGIDDPKVSSKVAVIKKDSEHVNVIYKADKPSNVEVAIYNNRRELQFSEVIKRVDNFNRPYDLSKLAKGEYTIVVKQNGEELIEKLTLKEEVSPLLAQVIKLKGNDNRYLLTVADRKSSSITVKIFNTENELVYEKEEPIQGEYSRVFNLDGSARGCTFSITSESGITQSITK
jgi:hypothetical protein